jgi:hypothetical protein
MEFQIAKMRKPEVSLYMRGHTTLDRVATDFARAAGITAQLPSKSIRGLGKVRPTEIDGDKVHLLHHCPFQSRSSRPGGIGSAILEATYLAPADICSACPRVKSQPRKGWLDCDW